MRPAHIYTRRAFATCSEGLCLSSLLFLMHFWGWGSGCADTVFITGYDFDVYLACLAYADTV